MCQIESNSSHKSGPSQKGNTQKSWAAENRPCGMLTSEHFSLKSELATAVAFQYVYFLQVSSTLCRITEAYRHLLALKRLTGYPFVLKHRLINMIKLSFCDHHSTNQFFSWRISCGFPFSLSPFLFLQNLDFVIFLFSPLFFPALQSFLWFPFKLQSPSFLNPLSGLNLNH